MQQELLIEELAVRAFRVTDAEQRDTVSYGDVGVPLALVHLACLLHSQAAALSHGDQFAHCKCAVVQHPLSLYGRQPSSSKVCHLSAVCNSPLKLLLAHLFVGLRSE